jgi:hypothetical protein
MGTPAEWPAVVAFVSLVVIPQGSAFALAVAFVSLVVIPQGICFCFRFCSCFCLSCCHPAGICFCCCCCCCCRCCSFLAVILRRRRRTCFCLCCCPCFRLFSNLKSVLENLRHLDPSCSQSHREQRSREIPHFVFCFCGCLSLFILSEGDLLSPFAFQIKRAASAPRISGAEGDFGKQLIPLPLFTRQKKSSKTAQKSHVKPQNHLTP